MKNILWVSGNYILINILKIISYSATIFLKNMFSNNQDIFFDISSRIFQKYSKSIP